jgi:hypothetical protein
VAGKQNVALERVLKEAVHASANSRVRANPNATLSVDAISNEPDLASSLPHFPKSSLRGLLETSISRQAAQHCKFECQTTSTGTAGFGNFTSTAFRTTCISILV